MQATANYPRFTYMMRHAEKVSNVTGEKTPNTSITANGQKQALAAGKFMAKQIKQSGVYNAGDKVLLLVSPYLRCLQTAKYLTQEFTKQGVEFHKGTAHVVSNIKENQKGKNGKSPTTIKFS
jgi:broad specificity phosphatase PhoE